jgi:hypothetical protein
MQCHSTVAASALLSVILVKVEKRRPVNNPDELRFEAGPASRRRSPRPQRRLASRQSPRGLARQTSPATFAQSLTGAHAGVTPAGMTTIHLFVLSALVVLCGCAADTQALRLDNTHRTPKPAGFIVEVFQFPQKPTKPTTTIAELTWRGSQADELKAEQHFMDQARKLGADAIAMERMNGEYEHAFGAMGGQVVLNFLYKAHVLVYEP